MEYTDDKMSLGSGTLVNRQHSHQHPHTQASPQGEDAIWRGPLRQEGRPHAPGSSRGPNGLKVLKFPTPYESKPITQCAKKGQYFESYTGLL